MNILITIISLLGILLAFGFLAMIIMEVFNSIYNLRGRNLNKALVKILAPGDETRQDYNDELYKKFINSSFYRQLCSGKSFTSSSHPQYLEFESFWNILISILYPKRINNKKVVFSLNSIQGYLGQLLQEHPYDLDDPEIEIELKPKVQYLFDSSMDRAYAESKRSIIGYLLLISFLIAFMINVDVFQMFKSITQPPDSMVNRVPLLGWDEKGFDLSVLGWMIKVIGCLISAIVMAFCASFLFQLFSKLVNIRSTHRFADTPQVFISTEQIRNENENPRSNTNFSLDSNHRDREVIQPAENFSIDLNLASKEDILVHLPTIKKMVSEGHLELAMQTVLSVIDLIPEDNQNELIALSGRYKVLLNSKSQKLVSSEYFTINESQISHAFLRFVNKLKVALK